MQMRKGSTRSSIPAFSLARIKELATARKFRIVGKKANRQVETHCKGTKGFLQAVDQLSTADFSHSQTDDIPIGCHAADVYTIWLDEDMKRCRENHGQTGPCRYYFKFSIENDEVLLSLSNHPG